MVKVAGIEVPALQLRELTPSQLRELTPFERDTCRRLDYHDQAIHEIRGAVEGMGKEFQNLHRDLTDHANRESKRASRRSWLQALVTPTVAVAVIAAAGNVWQERIKADAISKAEGKATAAVSSAIPMLDERSTVRADQLAKAIVDEQERRERQRPVHRDPDVLTPFR